ncbi:MAG TPA: IclR family transcriptional regulator [Ramlibacter sp.]|nr:IclR family transcriptional regulator [Ramlibacter sp.]
MKKKPTPPAQSPGRPRKALPSQAAPAARAAQVAAPAEAGVAALERGLSILDAFSLGAGTLSLAELAGATGLYKSTILRLCASLLRLGFLQRLDDGRYRLGPAVFQLGRRYQQSFRLGDLVVPVLRELVARSGETASFYVRDGDRDTCLYRIESPRPIRDAGVAEGDTFPVDSSAGSRVLSAFLGARGSQHEAVRRELVVVAKQSKRVAGAGAVICPVFGVDHALAGTLVLSGPESRFADPAIAAMKTVIREQAAALTTTLGGDSAVFRREGAPAH